MEKLKYTTEKPKDGRYYFLPSSTEVVDPDGELMMVEWMPDLDEEGEPVEGPPGTKFFGHVREWIPKEDARKGIYIMEADYARRMAELDEEYRRKYPDEYEEDDEDKDDDGDALKKVVESLSAISDTVDGV